MRINRFLASAGLGSRRSCEELILTGQVTINGVMCENLATQVEPSDVVKVGNEVLKSAAPMTIVINKPPGYLCTASDTEARPTVFDLLPPEFPRLFHVGRLDRDSEGLLILTNDGDLSLKLTHPRYKVAKEYEVVLDHTFDFTLVPKLLHGMSLEEGWAKAESVYKLAPNKVKMVLRQGLKRQIRKMFYELGYEVIKLVRTHIGPIAIATVEPGGFRPVTPEEISALLAEGERHAAEHPRPPRKPRYPLDLEARDSGGFHHKPRHGFGHGAEEGGERSGRSEDSESRRPYHVPYREGGKGGARGHGSYEEIPFITRARRKAVEEGETGATYAGSKPGGFHGGYSGGGKPFEHKPWLKKKRKERAAVAAHAAKPKPHPFAKFEKRHQSRGY